MTAEIIAPQVIQQVPLFRGLNATECRQVTDIARPVEFLPGEVILQQGQRSQDLWIVLEGRAEVVRDHVDSSTHRESIVLATLEPYTFFGEMSFFSPAPHSATVRAQTAVKLLRIARSDYDDLIRDGVAAAYKLAYNTMEKLANRLRYMDEWLAELAARETIEDQSREWGVFRDKIFDGWNL